MPDPCQTAAGVSAREEAVLVLRGKRLAALGMKLAIEQCSVEARGPHNGANVQHAALEAIVRCIQGLIGMRTLSPSHLLPADTVNEQIARLAFWFLACSHHVVQSNNRGRLDMKEQSRSTARELASMMSVQLQQYACPDSLQELSARVPLQPSQSSVLAQVKPSGGSRGLQVATWRLPRSSQRWLASCLRCLMPSLQQRPPFRLAWRTSAGSAAP